MKFRIPSLIGVCIALAFTACKEDEPDTPTPVVKEEREVIVATNITSNQTWTADKTYILASKVVVTSGTTLTIQPGTVIKGKAGIGSTATALLIARGAKIMAEGTAALPIVFTSVADDITAADVAAGKPSPNLDPTISSLWGGVLILGKAKISAINKENKTDLSEVQIEGIPASETNGLYGGSDNADNSGVFKYVSIRHGGANIGNGNEINGLSLGGVGSGTVIENLEIVGTQDDGIEFFGGTVNVKNVVVWNPGDDGIDTDQSWGGTLDNYVIITPFDHAHELDGPEGSYAAGHALKNGTILASTEKQISADLINVDANSIVSMTNIFFTGIKAENKINRTNAKDVKFENIMLDVKAEDLAKHLPEGSIPAGIVAGGKSTTNFAALSWTWAAKANPSIFNAGK